MSTAPLVSVVVAARNSASTLPACLDALAHQDHPLVEVIVVDDGSDDDTAVVAEAAGVRVVRTPAIGASAARNLGIEIARGEIVAFTDGDCVADPGWARALVEGLQSSGATGVGGKQVNVFPPGRRSLRDGFEAFFRAAALVSDYTRGDARPRPVQHNASCCSAYRIGPLRAIGGFTPGLWPGEDVDLDLRLAAQGATFYYVPSAVVHHHRPGTFAWFRRMMRRYGAAERRLVRLHGRKRLVDHVPRLLALVLAMQLLALWPAARSAIVAIDAVLLLGGIGVLWSTTPLRHWPTVMIFGATALWEWHVGWLTAREETA
jgi:glycosyltransferase involved in cell wall biosynthesis